MPSSARPYTSRPYYDKNLIKQALHIRTVLQAYNVQILQGEQVRCPFHGEDKKASATVRNNFFYCFTCGLNLDVFSFVMAMENCTFAQALRLCAELVGIEPTTTQSDLAQTLAKRQAEQEKQEQLRLKSEAKYSLLARLARTSRPINPPYMAMLDYLLDAWLCQVPEWVDTQHLVKGYDIIPEMHRHVTRLFQESEVRNEL